MENAIFIIDNSILRQIIEGDNSQQSLTVLKKISDIKAKTDKAQPITTMAWILIASGVALVLTSFWGLLKQRVFIYVARWLKFKKDDTEKVEKKVNEILGEDDAEKNKSKSSGK